MDTTISIQLDGKERVLDPIRALKAIIVTTLIGEGFEVFAEVQDAWDEYKKDYRKTHFDTVNLKEWDEDEFTRKVLEDLGHKREDILKDENKELRVAREPDEARRMTFWVQRIVKQYPDIAFQLLGLLLIPNELLKKATKEGRQLKLLKDIGIDEGGDATLEELVEIATVAYNLGVDQAMLVAPKARALLGQETTQEEEAETAKSE